MCVEGVERGDLSGFRLERPAGFDLILASVQKAERLVPVLTSFLLISTQTNAKTDPRHQPAVSDVRHAKQSGNRQWCQHKHEPCQPPPPSPALLLCSL